MEYICQEVDGASASPDLPCRYPMGRAEEDLLCCLLCFLPLNQPPLTPCRPHMKSLLETILSDKCLRLRCPASWQSASTLELFQAYEGKDAEGQRDMLDQVWIITQAFLSA